MVGMMKDMKVLGYVYMNDFQEPSNTHLFKVNNGNS